MCAILKESATALNSAALNTGPLSVTIRLGILIMLGNTIFLNASDTVLAILFLKGTAIKNLES